MPPHLAPLQAGRESLRERDGAREGGTGGSPPSPKATRSTPIAPHHPSPVAVSPNPSGVVLLSQRPLDSSHKLAPGEVLALSGKVRKEGCVLCVWIGRVDMGTRDGCGCDKYGTEE